MSPSLSSLLIATIASSSFLTPITEMPSTIDASLTFLTGRITFFMPASRKAIIKGKTPSIGIILPDRDSSPMTAYAFAFLLFTTRVLESTPIAIGRSR